LLITVDLQFICITGFSRRTNGRTVLRPSVCRRLSVTLCIVAKRCVL